MPSSLGQLFVRLGLDARDFKQGIQDAGRNLKSIDAQTSKFNRSMVSLKNIASTLFVGWGIKKISGEFLDAAKTTENYRTRLQVLLGSVSEGSRLFKEMSDYAGRVPFEYKEIMGAATQLSGVMKGGVDEIKKWMPLIGDLAAASGLSIQQTTEQVVRMYSAGAGAADLFRERGITAMLGFQSGVSYSVEETRKKMMEEWQKAGSQFKGATEKLSDDWMGLMSMFNDTWFQFRVMVMESGPFQAMKESAKDLLSEIKKLKEQGKLKEWAEQTGTAIIDMFETASYGLEILINSVKGIELVFSGTITAISIFTDKILGAYQTIQEAYEKIYDTVGATEYAKATRDVINDIKEMRANINLNRDAGSAMSNDLIDGMNATHEAFDKIRERLKDMKVGAEVFGETLKIVAKDSGQVLKNEIIEIDKWYADFYKKNKNEMDEWIKITEEWADFDKALWDKRTDEYLKDLDKITTNYHASFGEIDADAMKSFNFQLKKMDQFNAGVTKGLEEITKNWADWTEFGYSSTIKLANAGRNAMSDLFFNAMKGDMDSFKDVWKSFTDSLLRSFADMLASMVVKWTASGVGNLFGIGGSIGGAGGYLPAGGIGGPGEGWGTIAGIGGMAATGAAIGSAVFPGVGTLVGGAIGAGAGLIGKIFDIFHGGGVVGLEGFHRFAPASLFHDAPRFHNGLMPGEFPAILQRGELVFTPEQMRILSERGGGININAPLIYVEGNMIGNRTAFNELVEKIDERLRKITRWEH